MTQQRELVVELFPIWKDNILRFVARCLGIKGIPVGFIYCELKDEVEMTINDIKRAEEESAENRVRSNN